MDIAQYFQLIADRARLNEQYIKGEISKETYYHLMDQIDRLMGI